MEQGSKGAHQGELFTGQVVVNTLNKQEGHSETAAHPHQEGLQEQEHHQQCAHTQWCDRGTLYTCQTIALIVSN